MSGRPAPLRALAIALSWALLWVAAWALVAGAVWILDPDSLDPGEGWMFIVVFGPMGLLTGAVLAGLLRIGGRDRSVELLSLAHGVGLGTLATAAVQVLYLGHGDQGLAANVAMALLFCGVGALVTAGWLVATRRWLLRRSGGP